MVKFKQFFQEIRPGERSFLILVTRAEDNFTQLEKISYPHHEHGKSFLPHPSFSQIVGTPPRSPEVFGHKI